MAKLSTTTVVLAAAALSLLSSVAHAIKDGGRLHFLSGIRSICSCNYVVSCHNGAMPLSAFSSVPIRPTRACSPSCIRQSVPIHQERRCPSSTFTSSPHIHRSKPPHSLLFMSNKSEEATTPIVATTQAANSNSPSSAYPLIILIGGSGFLGSEIRKQLQKRGVEYIATATPATAGNKNNSAENDEGEFVPLDLTAPDAEEQFYNLIKATVPIELQKKEVAVISAMGTIGTKQDEMVNAALVKAIKACDRVNNDNLHLLQENEENNEVVAGMKMKIVDRFVMIGNTERVRRLARNVPFLKGYASGKDVSLCFTIAF